MDTILVEHYGDVATAETLGNESDLHFLKGNGKGRGFKPQYIHCGQCGHRVVECRKRDIEMIKGKGENKGFGRGKNPPQEQMMCGECEKWIRKRLGHGMILGSIL